MDWCRPQLWDLPILPVSTGSMWRLSHSSYSDSKTLWHLSSSPCRGLAAACNLQGAARLVVGSCCPLPAAPHGCDTIRMAAGPVDRRHITSSHQASAMLRETRQKPSLIPTRAECLKLQHLMFFHRASRVPLIADTVQWPW